MLDQADTKIFYERARGNDQKVQAQLVGRNDNCVRCLARCLQIRQIDQFLARRILSVGLTLYAPRAHVPFEASRFLEELYDICTFRPGTYGHVDVDQRPIGALYQVLGKLE